MWLMEQYTAFGPRISEITFTMLPISISFVGRSFSVTPRLAVFFFLAKRVGGGQPFEREY